MSEFIGRPKSNNEIAEQITRIATGLADRAREAKRNEFHLLKKRDDNKQLRITHTGSVGTHLEHTQTMDREDGTTIRGNRLLAFTAGHVGLSQSTETINTQTGVVGTFSEVINIDTSDVSGESIAILVARNQNGLLPRAMDHDVDNYIIERGADILATIRGGIAVAETNAQELQNLDQSAEHKS